MSGPGHRRGLRERIEDLRPGPAGTVRQGAIRGAIGFGLGSALLLAPVVVPGLSLLVLTWVPAVAGGILAAASLRAGPWTTVGFGAGFVPPGFLYLLGSVAPQAMGQGLGFWSEEGWLVVPMAVAFALMGGLASSLSGLGMRVVLVLGGAFAVCGAAGGLLYALWALRPGPTVLFAAAVVVPFAMAGAAAGALFAAAARAGHGTR